MKIASKLFDARINAYNLLVEVSICDYETLVKDVVKKNEFQRKRVRSSKSVYALLREDLIKQCVIPPIVLALADNIDFQQNDDDDDFQRKLEEAKDHLVILDGLQRTYTILELLYDLRASNDEATLSLVMGSKIRIEIYVGLNRLGILYRMLTLNTGQTPMSLRQQIEMLYLDYLTKEVDGVELIRESEAKNASKLNQYNFKDVVEGFNAYLDRDELPIDKADILENINSLEKLSKENQNTELFEKYLASLNKLVAKFNDECDDLEVSDEYIKEKGAPFGKNILQILKRPQAISGFGAAVGKLLDFEILTRLDDVCDIVDDIKIDDPNAFLEQINDSLLWLKGNSKKIGNAQRSYFTFFFRDLLNRDSDSYCKPLLSSKSALRKYQAQNM
ncbi:GmrSD restriction endonuclease domain-containing protein [Marinobacterium rhizophilum]|uniref:GmrSD restriction endonuclease domain-containing protein n=1 Tax=Marinobacterium rhizophilum TaxID=420402 RepID=UPI0003719E31|nr:DUF262 domain-containing protein [Marinobacterium rhizophilum]